ncbi:MAG TPA: hypothetical protein VMQ83_08175 [Gammaproteobacteria bacterium]|nr:hypothetical protein [Gammaproteobacteria bacterium]
MDAYRLAVYTHLAAGTLALVTYWSAALARKGSPLHIAIGRTYLVAMIVVLVTAAGLSAAFVVRGRPAIGTFLAYLVVITATACWLAWRAIRTKRAPADYFGAGFRRLGWLNLGAGLATFAIGVKLGIALLMIFSWVGILGGAAMVRQARRPQPENRRWWLREHYFNVLGMGVATHIAFLGLGLNRFLAPLGIQPPQLLAWTLPLAVAILARIWLDRRYGPAGFDRARGPATRPGPA